MAFRWSILAALGCLLSATGTARAATSCVNDIDCPNAACGGDVCDYYTDPTLTCKPAGTHAKGMDGWCTTDADCKCRGLGAVCTSSLSCSFTKPSDAPSGGGGAVGTGGATGAAGSTTPGSGGTTGTGTGGAGGAGPTNNNGGSSGGCSVAGSHAPSTWLAFSVLGIVVGLRRRRRA
ncbi:MAG: MYXO-CTERM sorting domain-containing protein [Polyangia bacterium]